MIKTVLVTVLAVTIVTCEENVTYPKPFGITIGPTYIGGRDTDQEGTQLSLKIYKQYINYKRLMSESYQEDEMYYERWTDQNECIGSCAGKSFCQSGVCICDHSKSVTQIYGRCFANMTASFVGNKEKYRKPDPPPRPKWCFCKKRDSNFEEVCPDYRNREECRVPHIPDNFDHNTQFCLPRDHAHCSALDINMYCGEKTVYDPRDGQNKPVCQCRKDMRFDTKNMECRLYLNVDCTYEREDPAVLKGHIVKVLTGQSEPTQEGFTKPEVQTAFCNLLESYADEYNKHIVGEFNFSLFGLGLGTLILIAFATCCAACCCSKCCESTREKIRRLDPRYAMKQAGMGQGAQLATLGAVAAGEYMENRNDKQDEARIAAMQGQSMGMPGGAPMGYAPVPTGYPEGPAYPQPGYPQPGYPQPGPGYPQPGQPGYIPPADGGPGIMNMAPELALAGAGAFSGNTAMTGMGVVAAAEKMGDMEDKEDRLRAAAIRGVPPPPMGYAGGAQPTYPQNQLPPSTANYPRQ